MECFNSRAGGRYNNQSSLKAEIEALNYIVLQLLYFMTIVQSLL